MKPAPTADAKGVGVGGHALLFYILANLGLGLAVLLPFAGVDGEVIWREMRR